MCIRDSVEPHGTLIVEGKKKAMVKSRRFLEYANKPLLLIESKRALGIIEYGEPQEIDWKAFEKYRDVHRVTKEEAERWGWTKYETLWMYPIRVLKVFDRPIEVDYPAGPQVFVSIEKIKLKGGETGA